MNIKEAKTEIINTLRAYHHRDEAGHYTYPVLRQRPILLMGPPGIGKTAIMEQVARECGVGLVAYTITHHTRQSAIGLPKIVPRMYGGEETDVTEYTMSEIIASVYDCMEKTGKKEGILFIDEINCVSETLAPTMLQFLQNKTFGSHRVPEGWLIVAAGNPPQYNKSVREFDIVTLDRVRKIEIDVDCDIWMEYARKHEVHPAILTYLSMKKDHFYLVENTLDGKFFVTARGWEDLSQILKGYETLQVPVGLELVLQFLQKEEIARDFAAYYQLYCKYGADYAIWDILNGKVGEASYQEKVNMAKNGSFEERFTVVNLVLDTLTQSLRSYEKLDGMTVRLHELLSHLKLFIQEKPDASCFARFIQNQKKSQEVKIQEEMISLHDAETETAVIRKLEEYELFIRQSHITTAEEGFRKIKAEFVRETEDRQECIRKVKEQLDRACTFLTDCFGEGQEMILFLTALTRNEHASTFIAAHGCSSYFHYSQKLLTHTREKELQRSCLEALSE